jgi:hypothetical protein
MSEVRIVWGLADWEHGGLLVPFAERPPMQWCHIFSRSIHPLHGMKAWGEIGLTPDQRKVYVLEVMSRYERTLRVNLDGLVAHANDLYAVEGRRRAA